MKSELRHRAVLECFSFTLKDYSAVVLIL